MLCYVMLRFIMLDYDVLRYIVLCDVTSRSVLSCPILSFFVTRLWLGMHRKKEHQTKKWNIFSHCKAQKPLLTDQHIVLIRSYSICDRNHFTVADVQHRKLLVPLNPCPHCKTLTPEKNLCMPNGSYFMIVFILTLSSWVEDVGYFACLLKCMHMSCISHWKPFLPCCGDQVECLLHKRSTRIAL